MVDLYEQDKGNISLPAKLQSYEDENQKNKPTIINMQKTLYNIKITDIQNRLNRLEERNDELLEEIETTNEISATIDTETAEEIANLNKLLLAQNNSIESLKSKIDTLETDQIENKRSYEEKIVLFNQKYKKKKIELVSQIKVISAKINVLEDFKKVQNALKEKLEVNENQMVENEKNVKDTMEIIKRKIEFDKEMLKNEMYNCLLDLAAQFQVEINKYINLPNQRLMRENVMLKNELLQIFENVTSKMDTQINLKNTVIEYKKKLNVRSSSIKENIVIAKVQNEVLKHLRKKYQNTKIHLLPVNIPDPTMEQRYLLLMEKTYREKNDINFYISSLKTLLHKERTKINIMKYFLRKLECKIRALMETVYDLKYTVICLVKCPFNRKDLVTLSCIELFLFLRNILIKGQSKLQSNIIKSSETIPQELQSVSDIKDILEDIDFGIMTELIKIKSSSRGTLDKIKQIEDLDKEKEISTENSDVKEHYIEDIFEDTVDYNLEDDYELSRDDEYMGESLFNITEE